ncbi:MULTISPECIES: rhamnogalacturonan acetylesterase [Alteromonas]|uniref:GntR family transcriptional regulator n=1 Tax=Alteromonas stellipolaris TaxID=233316 RepID=A0ABM5YK11_9ALTE|nr:rhamnogalacturonan acetylesterase [Alteromonas stellipolaris]ALM90170.1 rhamnogalacturonan acetylesterase [Alteromonas stellipolaris LMG 21856]AMJ74800.1 GntR family transcriptional regulator [Alteromonas stellipolaris]MDO6539169.1 rhamnogalacturonan acetylesterase [Alteromonas stellipolaris]
MRQKLAIALSLLIGIVGAKAETQLPSISLHLVGDSTMSDKTNLAYPERGWGQVLPEFGLPQLSIKNHAANGRSTKRFVDEGRWSSVLSSLSANDYVLIQFGHNDQKREDPARFASADIDYVNYLRQFIDDVESKGATAIIASSICRRHYTDTGVLKRTLTDYALAARRVASEKGVLFVPMNRRTCEFLTETGEAESQQYFIQVPPDLYGRYPQGKIDNTHLNVVGAAKVAQFFVRELKTLDHPLSDYFYRDTL